MSQRLHPYDFKYVVAGTEVDMAAVKSALSSVVVKDLHKEGVSPKISPHILDIIKSTSAEPSSKIDIGAGVELKAVLLGSSLADLKAQLNHDSTVTDCVVQSTRIFNLPRYHAQYKIMLSDGTTVETWTYSYMYMNGSIDAAIKGKGEDVWYLPITLLSSADSELDIAQA